MIDWQRIESFLAEKQGAMSDAQFLERYSDSLVAVALSGALQPDFNYMLVENVDHTDYDIDFEKGRD